MNVTPMPAFAAPSIDPQLLARYDVLGPRYTSYPTAPHFTSDFGEVQLRAQADASNEDPIPHALSLYIHAPFCMSPCFYCGCNRVITRDREKGELYLARLYREIEMYSALFDRDRSAVQLHFGGGTPNFFDIEQMTEIMDVLARHFSLSRSAEREFGIELDPRYADADYVHALAGMGFNRLSMGIQDFDPEVQRAVNREQGVEETRTLIEAARQAGFRSISVDLIYGLPLQTPKRFATTLDIVLGMRPDRIAAYSYAHLPEQFKPQRQIDTGALPTAETKLELLRLTVEKLTAAGYVYIGMDHFALPQDDLSKAQRAGSLQRNFQGYSTHAECDIVAMGMSAISRIGRSFSQNARDLMGYYTALDQGRLPVVRGLQLSLDDEIRGSLIAELMCQNRIDIRSFGARYQIDFQDYFSTELQRLETLVKDGLVSWDHQGFSVTARGRLLVRTVAMCFDAYLERQKGPSSPRYSRTI